MSGRREELAAALAALGKRVDQACARSGRDPGDVTTIVVTKTHPVSDLALLADLGVVDVGEARDAEGRDKRAALVDRGLHWHAVGQVQTKKSSSVAGWADVVHSVDRGKLVLALGRGAVAVGRELAVLIQVDLDPGGSAAERGGASPSSVPGLADLVAATDGLRLAGVMAVAPLGSDPARAFALLRDTSDQLRGAHPAAQWISAGMSGDLEAAVAAGATHLRVGTAVLGSRPALG